MNLHRVSKFLETFEARLVEPADIMEAIRAQESRRNDRWTWMTKYQDEELPRWINDTDTLVFEITLASLKGVKSLDFAQQVWMLQPSLFEWQSWESREFDRIWWDPDARLRRRAPGGDTDA